MQENKPFGERLKAERVRLDLTQPQLAERAGVSKASQNAYESGQTSPDAAYLARVMEAGVDLQFLFAGAPAKLVAAQHLDWSMVADLLQVIRSFEQASGTKLPADTTARLLRILYASCAPLNKVDPSLVEAALTNAA